MVDTTPSSVNNIKNVAKYIDHTYSEEREAKVKVSVAYIHQFTNYKLNQGKNYTKRAY